FRRDVHNLLPRWPAPDQRLDVDPTARRAQRGNLLGELSLQPGSGIRGRVRARLVFVSVYQRDFCPRVLRQAESALERLTRAIAEVSADDDPSLARHDLNSITAFAPACRETSCQCPLIFRLARRWAFDAVLTVIR